MTKTTNTPKFKRSVVEAVTPSGEGREVMVIGPGCWGRGATGKEALKKALSHGGYAAKGFRFMVFDVSAGAYVDDMGGICYKGEATKEVMRGVIA